MRALGLQLSLVFGLFAVGACLPFRKDPPTQADIGTLVAATMQARETSNAAALPRNGDGSKDAVPTAPVPSELDDFPTPIPAPEELHIAFTDSGNIWLIQGTASPRQLTSSAGAQSIELSSDGAFVAFIHHDPEQEIFELHLVDTETGLEQVLLTQDDFDQLYEWKNVRHVIPSQIEFIAGTHLLLINTASILEGPGRQKSDDLLLFNVDTLDWGSILPPGVGGDFTISPDARKLAIMRSDSAGLVNVNGSGLLTSVLEFEPVITYSEFLFYPIPTWSKDSSRFTVVIPSSDPFAPEPEGVIWTIPADGSSPVREGTLYGQTYFPQLSGHSLIADDLAHVVFLRNSDAPNTSDLFYANLDTSGETAYASGDIQWAGWNPDSSRFVFGYGPMDLQFGSTGEAAYPLVEATGLRWVNESEYLYLVGKFGNWTLMRSEIGGGRIPLVNPSGDFVEYDFAG